MAIFSSNKKTKKDGATSTSSPPLNQSQSSATFSRSQSGSLATSVDRPQQQQAPAAHTAQATQIQQHASLHQASSSIGASAMTSDLGRPFVENFDPAASSGVATSVNHNNASTSSPAPGTLTSSLTGTSALGPLPAPVPAPAPASASNGTVSNAGPGAAPPSASSLSSSSHTILYPWAQRRLHLVPAALFPPLDPSNSSSAAPPPAIAGPISPPPFPRYGHSVNPVASTATGELYIFGGLVQNAVKNDLYVLHCAAIVAHTAGASVPAPAGVNGPLGIGLVETRGEVPGPRVGHASVGVGNVLIVWGGDTKSRPEDRQDDGLYLLNLSTKEWTRVKTIGAAPEGRYGHAASMVGSKFYIFGGQKDDGGFMNDLVWFDLQKLKAGSPKWTFVDYAPGAIVPPRRTGHTTVTHGDCIYVFGGTDGQYHYNDTWCFDTNTGIWVELSCIGYIPVPREGHAATLVDDVMYVFGGRGVDGKDLEDLAAFKISNQRWFMFQNMGPAPSGRSGHAMATWHNKVFVLGGESYTSQRADDPAFVHVLDTSKIKYPADSSRQTVQSAVSRKASTPTMGASASGNAIPSPATPTSPTATSLPSPRSGYDEDRRAASPTGSQRGGKLSSNGLPLLNSFGQVIAPQANDGSSYASGPKIGKRSATGAMSPPPVRPARPDEDFIGRSSRTVDFNGRALEERAMSPSSGQQPRSKASSPSLLVSSTGLGSRASKGHSPPAAATATFVGNGPGSPGRAARSPSPSADRNETIESFAAGYPAASANGLPPPDAFYYGSNAVNGRDTAHSPDIVRSKDQQIAAITARELWLSEALSLAIKRGFVAPDPTTRVNGDTEASASTASSDLTLSAALVQLKQELADAKSQLAEQAQSVDERIMTAYQARTAALHEATYYRSKLTALERGSPADVTSIERERSLDLERKLADALSARATLERRLSQLEGDVEHHANLRSIIEEQHAMATNRADAAESSYARALTDYAELQRRTHGHESTIQEHAERLVALTASSSQLTAENALLKEQLAASHGEVERHIAALEQAQVALTTAASRNDELHGLWETAHEAMLQHQSRAMQLQADLDAKHVELATSSTRATDLEKTLRSSREAHQAAQALLSGGLAGLLASSQQTKARSIPADDGTQAERVRALERERDEVKRLHQETLTQSESKLVELQDVRQREAQLRGQIVELQAELAAARRQHAQALDEGARHRSAVANRDAQLSDLLKAKETADVRAGLLRNVMSDQGFSPEADSDLAARYPPLTGSETSEQLHRRVQDLEARLEQRTRAHRELEDANNSAHQQHASKVEELDAALQRLRIAAPTDAPIDRERVARAESELSALQDRHRQLEGTHLKAVQYVKGTEKMLRRMKEELTRYKERCEELESKDRAPAPEHVAELESLRSQMAQARDTSDAALARSVNLERQISSMRGEHQRALNDSRSQADQRLQQLTEEVARMETELTKAQHDLEETLAVNASLNKELTSALKKSGPSSRGAPGQDDIGRLEAELTQAQNKAEWLKRENAQLESRCRTAESKITILLDHLEGAPADGRDAAADEAERWTTPHHGDVSDRGSE